jgi:hypothetical protein
MIEFPTIVYRVPGPYKAPGGKGRTYDYHGAQDKAEFDQLLSNGWFETIASAQDAQAGAATNESDEPTRAELEQKAMELGVKFDGRTTDKKLLDRIEQALKG